VTLKRLARVFCWKKTGISSPAALFAADVNTNGDLQRVTSSMDNTAFCCGIYFYFLNEPANRTVMYPTLESNFTVAALLLWPILLEYDTTITHNSEFDNVRHCPAALLRTSFPSLAYLGRKI
jgi:hypothetical protein